MILTYICYLPGALSPEAIADLVEADLGFEPEKIRTEQFGGANGVKFTSKSLERLRALDAVSSMTVVGGDESLSVTGMGGWPGQVIVMETIDWPSKEVIRVASVLPGFVAAMVGDGDDVFWQSADQINTYQVHGRPWEHLPKVRDEIFDRDKIDISSNPGRQAPAPAMWLWAASKLWFGPGSFSLIERDRLLDLPVGTVTTRADGVVIVDLFDLGNAADKIRDVQRRFRDWLGYDSIEASAPDLVDGLADPRVEFETGTFPNGGVRRVTEWRSGGRLVRKSAATERRTVEMDADGDPVWEDVAEFG